MLCARKMKEATDLVSQGNKDFEDVLTQLEQQRQEMESARAEAERLRLETMKIKEQSEEYNAQFQKERERALEQARREAREIIEEARRTANAATEEIKALKKQLMDSADAQGINHRQAELRRTLNEAEANLRENLPQKDRPAPAINKDGSYELQAGIMKLTAKSNEIYLIEQQNPYKQKVARPAHSGREMKTAAFASEVDLRGMDTVEAICVLDRYLDEAMRSNLQSVRIIHGKGTGALRSAVQQSLRKNRFVKTFRLGVYGEGEDGVTIAEFV